MSSIDGKISCDHCGEYNHERSMVFTFRESSKQFVCHTCADEFIEEDELDLVVAVAEDMAQEEGQSVPLSTDDDYHGDNSGVSSYDNWTYFARKELQRKNMIKQSGIRNISDTTVADEDIFFACDECGTMTAEHMIASINVDAGNGSQSRNCCPMCYSECYEDPRGISTEYTINYLEVIKHEVKVTAMSRAQAERITLSGDKEFALRTTRLPQTIGKSIMSDGT